MNKKYNALIACIVFSANILLSAEARNIRKDLQVKYENNLLNKCQLIEDGLNFADILDRDIRIMEDHRNLLLHRIDNYKGSFFRSFVPFFNTLGALTLGGISVTTGICAFAQFDWVNRKWQGEGDWSIKTADTIGKAGSSFGIFSDKDIVQYNINKFKYLNEQEPAFADIAISAPVTGVVSLISGLLFIKSMYFIYRYHGKLDVAIAKWKTKISRDQAIIGILKELKYGNGL